MMKFVVVVAILAFAVAHEDGPDNLALHAEHFPHTQGSKSAIYQFQIDNNNAKAQKGKCKIGQRSPSSQKDIQKRFPGARITFPKLIRCNMHHINDFATVYVHAKVGPKVKEIPADDMIKASYSQNNELKESVELPLIDPSHAAEMFEDA